MSNLKSIPLILIMILILIISGCTKGSIEKVIEPKDKLAEIYIAALESFMKLDEGLNSNMKYIAIDTKTLEGAAEEDKKMILDYFKKYHVEVMDASFEDLREKGLFDENTLSLEGVLLQIKEVKDKSNSKITIEGSKYRSGLGAIGVLSKLKYKDDKWQVEKADITWIS